MVKEEGSLKYLDFVKVAIIHAVIYFFNLYCLAREKSGLLKPGVETVEGVVKSIVGPVYDKFHNVPIEVLKFVDTKIDDSVVQLDQRVPPAIKQVSAQAFAAAQQAPAAAQAVVAEVRRVGMVDTASGILKSIYTVYQPTAKELYTKYAPKVEQGIASAWLKLSRLPQFPQMVQVVIPAAAYCLDQYNETVSTMTEKGYKVSIYLPLVPMEKIAKFFGEEAVEMFRIWRSFYTPKSFFSYFL